MAGTDKDGPTVGSWAQSDGMVGLVAAIDDAEVTLFNPGDRQMARVPATDVTPLPAGTVRVELVADLPVPHGLAEESLQRWLATLADPVVRERAREAAVEAGLDEGPFLPEVRLSVVRPSQSGAICVCGAKVPAADGTTVECPRCGRPASARPTSDGRMS